MFARNSLNRSFLRKTPFRAINFKILNGVESSWSEWIFVVIKYNLAISRLLTVNNQFPVTVSILTPTFLKIPENQVFFRVFRGCKNGNLGQIIKITRYYPWDKFWETWSSKSEILTSAFGSANSFMILIVVSTFCFSSLSLLVASCIFFKCVFQLFFP